MLLTYVPFLLPRSWTVHSAPSYSKAKCWRERPASSGKHSSAALERPTVRRSPVSGTVLVCPSGDWISRLGAMGFHYRLDTRPPEGGGLFSCFNRQCSLPPD